jgi:hypothetical protein
MVLLEALLRRCRKGDQEAMEELIRRWERKLFYYVRRLVPDESDASRHHLRITRLATTATNSAGSTGLAMCVW